MNLSVNQSVGELVVQNPLRAQIFERFGIDFCCKGARTLDEACAVNAMDAECVLSELRTIDEHAAAGDSNETPPTSLTELANHIEATHHAYLRTAFPSLSLLITKIRRAHSEAHPELHGVAKVFSELRDELEDHIWKEEKILFPLCRALDAAESPVGFHCGTIANPIRVMEEEHDFAGQSLRELSSLTHGFQIPQGACNSYRAMLRELASFEQDLHLHIHKENNILFPNALAKEAMLMGASHGATR